MKNIHYPIVVEKLLNKKQLLNRGESEWILYKQQQQFEMNMIIVVII